MGLKHWFITPFLERFKRRRALPRRNRSHSPPRVTPGTIFWIPQPCIRSARCLEVWEPDINQGRLLLFPLSQSSQIICLAWLYLAVWQGLPELP